MCPHIVACHSMAMNAGAGVFYEAAAEAAYSEDTGNPIDETLSGCLMLFSFSVVCIFFLLVVHLDTFSMTAFNTILTGTARTLFECYCASCHRSYPVFAVTFDSKAVVFHGIAVVFTITMSLEASVFSLRRAGLYFVCGLVIAMFLEEKNERLKADRANPKKDDSQDYASVPERENSNLGPGTTPSVKPTHGRESQTARQRVANSARSSAQSLDRSDHK